MKIETHVRYNKWVETEIDVSKLTSQQKVDLMIDLIKVMPTYILKTFVDNDEGNLEKAIYREHVIVFHNKKMVDKLQRVLLALTKRQMGKEINMLFNKYKSIIDE